MYPLSPPPRITWQDFPDVVLLASESDTKRHPEYPAAKAGDVEAAAKLVRALVDKSGIAAVRTLIGPIDEGSAPVFVSAHAYERGGVNAIPIALAAFLGDKLGIAFETTVVQANIACHTGADGYSRLARQARFEGCVDKGRSYVMVDDFVGQGGTLANLRGWIEHQGSRVVGAVALTGKPYSAKLNPSSEQLYELREKHGRDFEDWWRAEFGHSFDCLTRSEARYLARSSDADAIRNRLDAAS